MPFDPDWAITDDLSTFIVNHFERHQPKVVVEFGSGRSTELFGGLVGSGGSVTAFEQSPVFAEQTFQQIYQMPWVNLVTSTIVDGWYGQVDVPDQIDFVLVDGPGPCKNRTRRPAMDAVYGHLADDAFIFVDDANRQSAQEDVASWLDKYPNLAATFVNTERGAYALWQINA